MQYSKISKYTFFIPISVNDILNQKYPKEVSKLPAQNLFAVILIQILEYSFSWTNKLLFQSYIYFLQKTFHFPVSP